MSRLLLRRSHRRIRSADEISRRKILGCHLAAVLWNTRSWTTVQSRQGRGRRMTFQSRLDRSIASRGIGGSVVRAGMTCHVLSVLMMAVTVSKAVMMCLASGQSRSVTVANAMVMSVLVC